MKRAILVAFVAALLVAFGAAASSAQAQPAPSWAGTWKTSFGTLQLMQQGDQVSGVYGYRNGRLSGRVVGNVLSGQWVEGSGQSDEYRGDFRFVMSPDGQGYLGRWGKGHGQPMPGRWNGQKMN